MSVLPATNGLAGRPRQARIEGIALEMPDLPSSIRLRYSVRVGGSKTDHNADGRCRRLCGYARPCTAPGRRRLRNSGPGGFPIHDQFGCAFS